MTGPGNPFDTGLPMAPTPGPRRPRRGARRRPPLRRIVEDPGYLPDPDHRGGDRDGGWQEWLGDTHRRDPARPAPVLIPNSWDDPGSVGGLIDRTGGARADDRQPARTGRGRRRAGVLLASGTTAVVAAVTVVFTSSGQHTSTPVRRPAPAAPSVPAPPPVHATNDCREIHSASEISGTGPGGTGSGPAAILRLEDAYYVDRSGAAARDVLAPDATSTYADGSQHPLTPAALQAGIDDTPLGTRYCVRITRLAATADRQQWKVELIEQLPGEHSAVSRQTVTTRTADDRTLITKITP